MEKRDYSKTYWSGKGTYQVLADKISELIPAEGHCPPNVPALESYRLAANLYYDLYNNGGCNYPNTISDVFDIDVDAFDSENGAIANRAIARVEIVMDRRVLAAAQEAGIE